MHKTVHNDADGLGRVRMLPMHKDDAQELYAESSKPPSPEGAEVLTHVHIREYVQMYFIYRKTSSKGHLRNDTTALSI